MKAHGNVVDHEYEIERDGDTVATISKKWFRVRESYGVDVAAGEDASLILAITGGHRFAHDPRLNRCAARATGDAPSAVRMQPAQTPVLDARTLDPATRTLRHERS
jgi:hypothetical protein